MNKLNFLQGLEKLSKDQMKKVTGGSEYDCPYGMITTCVDSNNTTLGSVSNAGTSCKSWSEGDMDDACNSMYAGTTSNGCGCRLPD